MKKYLMIGFVAAVAFTSCSKNDFETMSQEQIDKAKYDQKFVETFGTPDPNHTWGFGATTRAFTRTSINVNGNEELYYNAPALLGEEEDQITAYVRQLTTTPHVAPTGLKNYFVTQVHDGEETYKNADGVGGILGSSKMNHLQIAMEAGGVINDDGSLSAAGNWMHINNFNKGDNTDWNGNTLVIDGGTYNFAYHGTEDNRYHDRWISVKGSDVDAYYNSLGTYSGAKYAGYYYICFDFEGKYAEGTTQIQGQWWNPDSPNASKWDNFSNITLPGDWTNVDWSTCELTIDWTYTVYVDGQPINKTITLHLNDPAQVQNIQTSNYVGGNQVIEGNNKYDDWIVRLVEAQPKNDNPDPDPITYAYRIMAEDLTVATNSDFDFNDVVFDAKIDATANKTYIKLLAAGGTLELYIGDESHEVHHLFNVGKTTMVNTINPDYNTAGVTFELPYYSSYDAIPIYVKKNGVWEPITAQKGEPASKFACPVGTEWQVEYTNIDEKYEHFTDWVSDETKPFWVEW